MLPNVFRKEEKMLERFNDLFDDFDVLFKHPFFSYIVDTKDYVTGRENYNEETKEYSITIAVPGFDKEDISIETQDDIMFISGEIKDEKAKTFYCSNSFKHSRKIKNLDINSIDVELKNGILNIKYKLKEEIKSNKFKIQIK